MALARGGRYTAFTSAAGDILETGDSDGKADVFRRDLASGDVELVSADVDVAADAPVVSPDGRWVAFRAGGVFLRDVAADKTIRVNDAGEPVAGLRRRPVRARRDGDG